MEFYKDIKIINNPNDINVLVNKNNKLPDNYIPNDLVTVDSKYSENLQYLRKIANDAFIEMCDKAKEDGYYIKAVSTYRSYDYQDELYHDYYKKKGIKYADMCSAKAGHSEHQTGLAIDIADVSGDYNNFINTKEFNWIKDNAHKFGFILRYPNNKTHITGFKYEPWHYRYIGISIATYIYKNNITLEEYKKLEFNL